MRGLATLAAICAFAPSIAMAQSGEALVLRKKVAGGYAFIDGANGWSKVMGLKPGAGSFLAVRAGPGETFVERDRLKNERFVFSVATRGDWRGIIYTDESEADVDRDARACGIDDAIAKTMPATKKYEGPCKWGWVNKRWLVVLAD